MRDLTRGFRRSVIVGAAATVIGLGLAGPASAQTGGTGYQVGGTEVQGVTQVRSGTAGALPRTGTDTQSLFTGAGLLLLAGGAAVHLSRKRSAES